MDIILKEIVAIIKEETENINKKIYGTTFLELLIALSNAFLGSPSSHK